LSCTNIITYESLKYLTNLTALCLYDHEVFDEYDDLRKLTNLKSLTIVGRSNINASSIKYLTNLKYLCLYEFDDIRSKHIYPLTKLKDIELIRCHKISETDIRPKLPNLIKFSNHF